MLRAKSLLLTGRNAWHTLYVSAPTVFDAMRGRVTREVCDQRLGYWAEHVIKSAEITIHVKGRENRDPNVTYLLMSNHQSHYDIAVMYWVLGSNIRMVAKRELFDVPVFGKAIDAAGFVSVDRGNTESAIASLEDAKAKLASGIPMWIAPEGTRSPTGALMPFKKGGFMIALATGAPILPISISGTRDVLRAKGLRSRPGVEVTVTIHPSIDPKSFTTGTERERRDALSEAVRHAIASAL